MDKITAIRKVETVLKRDFKYLCKKRRLDAETIHLTFSMDSKTHDLQTTFKFSERWCDMLCFISPTILTKKYNDNYWEALQTINYINWNTKSWGRFYIDSYGDIAYSLRLNYYVIEKMPHESTKEIEVAIDYYADLFVPLLNVCQGKAKFDDIKQFIDDMWGGLQ
ncbi:hypothetical protein [Caldifermentibacillus hisashii]|uniref:hypothetical protein n=1 Tax=Caldifermentibacillus hisashii TaxID=996558 RepID=UPI00310120B0